MRRDFQTVCAVFAAAFSSAVFAPLALAAPPALDAKPALSDTLVQGKWQPLLITVQNPDSGEALQGEIQVALDETRQQTRLATYTAPVSLPRGAATLRVPVTVFVPQNGLPEVTVFVVNGRGGKGEVVTRRKFDKIPVLPNTLTLLAVSATPDALHTLQGEKLGVLVGNAGGLRLAVAPADPGKKVVKPQPYTRNGNNLPMPLRVVNRPDAGVLPTRSVGYESVSMVYLGRDVLPDTFSDAQIDALRGWVAGGGLLISASPKLRTDERFRQWLPLPSSAPTHWGRGTISSPAFDPADSVFAASGQSAVFWKSAARAGVTPFGVTNALTNSAINYNGMYFWNSLFRAPGLQAPGAGMIGVFLAAYLFLLVPLNYFVLRKLGKREWMWATAPILVIMFSLGAYGFGYATKGTQLFQNVATVSEMQNGSGEAATCGGVGLFSPRRARYAVQVAAPDAILWTPSQGGYSRQDMEYSPLVISQEAGSGKSAGVTARGSEVSMWAMRAWAFRTNSVRLGSGVNAQLRRDAVGQITGTVTNNTGKPLTHVWVSFRDRGQNIGPLQSGQSHPVSFGPKTNAKQSKSSAPNYDNLGQLFDPAEVNLPWDYNYSNQKRNDPSKKLSETEQRVAFQNAVAGGIQSAYSDSISSGVASGPPEAFVTAFNNESLVPVSIDGQSVSSGMNVNVLLVHVPLPVARTK